MQALPHAPQFIRSLWRSAQVRSPPAPMHSVWVERHMNVHMPSEQTWFWPHA